MKTLASKTSEARDGPKVLAGLREAPETPPIAQMIGAKERPMAYDPQWRVEDGDVEPMTVITRMKVPITSPSRAAK